MKAMRKYVVEIGAGILQAIFVVTPVLLGLFTVALAYLGSWNDAVLIAVVLLAYVLKSRMLRDEAAEHRLAKQHVADMETALRQAVEYLEGDRPTVTCGGHKNMHLRATIRAALTAHKTRKASSHG
ncbi:hypothetical protein [Stappia sp. WLB 29]|uniref:hypothetical protein n=1 Tax=Stappia sp. WLB 29 TaxID=2925220 RepID=UPI0020BFD517|nr:hypothetical protein [Stappia sp. WLB 29]